MNLISKLVAAAALALAVGAAHAQTPELPTALRSLGPTHVAGVDAAVLDHAVVAAIPAHGEFVMRAVPAGDGRTVDLRLERFEVLTPDAELVDVDQHGSRRAERAGIVLLRGTVDGDAGSWVMLGLADGVTNGWIESGDRTTIIASPGRGMDGPIAVYQPKNLPDGAMPLLKAVCGGALQVPGVKPDEPPAGGFTGRGLPCRVLTVAVDTDYEYLAIVAGLSPTRAQNYANHLMAAVSEIYRREFNTSLAINYLRIWSSNVDPYDSGTATTFPSVNSRLDEFRDHWNAAQTAVPRNLAHMLTGMQRGAGGIAYLSVVCNTEFGYGVSGYLNGGFPYPLVNNHPQNWDVTVVSHEIGHNVAAPHTHDMSPRIDGCGVGNCSQAAQGTIMSYCHTCAGGMSNIALNMHPRIINERIMPHLQSVSAWCSINRNAPTITQSPGPATRSPGQSITFQASAAGGQPMSWVWRRNGVPLTNNARITGATTASLTINPLQSSDAGTYSAVASNSCGSATSIGAALTVPCRADLNNDALVDFNDYLEFLNLFNQNNPRADFNADGLVDFNDYLEFLNLYNAGC